VRAMLSGPNRKAPAGRPVRVLFAAAALTATIVWTAAAPAATPHPLDPLTEQEIAEAVAIIASQGRTDRTTRAAIITLREPSKQQVLQWKSGDPIPRKAFAVLRVKGETVEAVCQDGLIHAQQTDASILSSPGPAAMTMTLIDRQPLESGACSCNARQEGARVDEAAWRRLAAFADRCLVEATETSRLTGAGAGVVDTD